MLRIMNIFFCILYVVYAADLSDLCICTYGLEEDGLQTLERPKFCIPVYPEDRSLDEDTQTRHKRSVDVGAEPWPLLRVNRDQKTIHLPSSFTPRLGRRRASGRMLAADPQQHVINLNAGTAFTPRLGRRVPN